MDSVYSYGFTIYIADRAWSSRGRIRVSDQHPQSLDRVFTLQFHSNHGAAGNIFDESRVKFPLLVDLVKLFRFGAIEADHLHPGDCKAITQNHGQDLADEPLLDDLGFYH